MSLNSYSIIDGKKYKKCKEGQIRNPLTKRCVKSKIINENYSIIDGKKYKKCKEGQIRNPLTKRCVKSKIPKKEINLSQKAKKIQMFFKPLINRISANIEDRIR